MDSASFHDDTNGLASVAMLSIFLGAIIAGMTIFFWIDPLSKDIAIGSLNKFRVPFIVREEPKWSDLSKSLKEFNQRVDTCLGALSLQLDAAKLREAIFGGQILSKSITERIETLSVILDSDSFVLATMLKRFALQQALPDQHGELGTGAQIQEDALQNGHCDLPLQNECTPPPRYIDENDLSNPTSSYDSSMQVMAHIVRDWTVLGRGVRSSTYGWCQHQLKTLHSSTILVPGAGLGRLAFDLAQRGHSVEANELSIVMAAVTNSILNQQMKGKIHPFSLDYFFNEVDHNLRKKAVYFPDVLIGSNTRGSLSFTLGEFVLTYAKSYNQYDAIITCFFIDTASNIYDYLAVIYNALKDGGQWINVGPLQWHSNAYLQPSVKELKEMTKEMGFSIQKWSIDDNAMDYRMDDNSVQSTKFEGYRPLRVVAVKIQREKPYRIHKTKK